uniref:NADH-ubiquinone oxidoreductase chain 3 n=1 Tax=Lepidotrigona flavibasis TaxID=2696055 RepID=A0A6B9MTS6_9HYME|nr:NADH dehydrogenase subunit 3 [Lepidotrigona flavibasis]
MLTCLMFVILVLVVSVIIMNMNKMLSMIKMINIQKKVPFECGFNPMSKFSIPFSMPFFMVSLLFLIFDIEITMLIPMILYIKFSNHFAAFVVIMLFMFSMIVTLIVEWFMGYLQWMF